MFTDLLIMALRASVTTTFEVDKVIQPIYTGGDVDIDRKGQILVTCLGEDAVLTDVNSGQTLARVEGVSIWRIDWENRNQLITSCVQDGEVLTTLLSVYSTATCSIQLISDT